MKEQAINDIVQLILKEQQGDITALEQNRLNTWADAIRTNQEFLDRCTNKDTVAADLARLDAVNEEAAWQRWQVRQGWIEPEVVHIRRNRSWVWMAAAVVTGALAVGGYYFWGKGSQQPDPDQVTVAKAEEIQPAGKKATLTLGDGKSITLDDAKDGAVANEDGAAVNKQGDALVYDPKGPKAEKAAVRYHAVNTPIGGFYELTLPDGTKVWLNADSRIHYPTAFVGRERRVEASGELYFEVAKDAEKPFIVSTGKTEVRVLGTHFNLRNYSDEAAIKTTLLEGAVQVKTEDNKTATLKPGQQAAVGNDASRIPVRSVDLESVVAWKEGYFDFKGEEMADIMKEIRRWYAGIDAIDFKQPVAGKFTASIPRNLPLSTVLRILQEMSKVKFKVVNKVIEVTE